MSRIFLVSKPHDFPSEWYISMPGESRFAHVPTYHSDSGWSVRRDERGWTIEDDQKIIRCCADTTALHPTSVMPQEWTFMNSSAELYFEHDMVELTGSTEDAPIDLELLGLDFFAFSRTQVVWFRDLNGNVHHSGAKAGFRGRTGKRYCHQCNTLISANNFVTQHLRTCVNTFVLRPREPEESWCDDGWMSEEAEPEDEFSLYLAGP